MKNFQPASDTEIKLVRGDCEEQLDSIEDGTVQLVITSPPYNIGKEYESDRKLALDEYLDWLKPIARKLAGKISRNGSLCWQVGNHVRAGRVYPLDAYFFSIFSELELVLRNRIIWTFNFGLNATKRLSGRYETLLWFTKSDEYIFNLDPIRVPQLYPGKRHPSSKGSLAGKPSGNPLGKNPSDFWEFSAEECFQSEPVWEIPNVKANHPEKTVHPCQFPIELAERCVLAFTNPGETVLDPFMGVGTAMIAAAKHDRKGIGIEYDPRYVEIASERIAALKEGTLHMRKSGRKPRKPKSGEKVARIPESWKNLAG